MLSSEYPGGRGSEARGSRATQDVRWMVVVATRAKSMGRTEELYHTLWQAGGERLVAERGLVPEG